MIDLQSYADRIHAEITEARLEKDRVKHGIYYWNHREEDLERSRLWYQAHLDANREKSRLWHLANREKHNEQNRAYKAKQRAEKLQAKEEQWQVLGNTSPLTKASSAE